jgi:putative transposase
MRTGGLVGVSRRRFVVTTQREGARQAPDLVARTFLADAPNQLCVADITYIPTWSGFLCLAIVLDVFSRRIVGWSMSTTLHTGVVLAALNMALAMRKPERVIHHSDQGSQYTSIAFGNRCREAGVRPSIGSVGDAYDYAMAESFFATLECELLARRRFKTQAEARMATFEFSERFYNPRRRHSALGYLSPIAFERAHAEGASALGVAKSAAVLAAVKDRPSRAAEVAVLDRRCARRRGLRRGRTKGRALDQKGGGRRVNQQRMIPRSNRSTKPGQVQMTTLPPSRRLSCLSFVCGQTSGSRRPRACLDNARLTPPPAP